jgi:ABC-2 type transport system permease protein
MAVFERSYRPYAGPLTPEKRRFLILPRYAYSDVFKSRLFAIFFALCFGVPFAGLLIIYLHHNLSALKMLASFGLTAEKLNEILPIDAHFFSWGMSIQGVLCFFITLFVGPALVAPDLRNNGLPLYLARPFSRAEYVLGKLCVLAILMSLVTWVPGLLLWGFQAYLEPNWAGQNLQVASALCIGSWIWILFLSLFALAVSAWVKWKPVARIALFMLYFIGKAFGVMVHRILGLSFGKLFDASGASATVWASLFGIRPPDEHPLSLAWITMVGGCLVFLWLLKTRLRAYEVVR